MLVFQSTPGSLFPPYPYTAAVAAHLLLQVMKNKIQFKKFQKWVENLLIAAHGTPAGQPSELSPGPALTGKR